MTVTREKLIEQMVRAACSCQSELHDPDAAVECAYAYQMCKLALPVAVKAIISLVRTEATNSLTARQTDRLWLNLLNLLNLIEAEMGVQQVADEDAASARSATCGVRVLADEVELRERLDELNDAGRNPAVAGEDRSGPFIASYLDGEGPLDVALVRPPGEDLHAHDENAEQLCTSAYRLGDLSLYWPVTILEPQRHGRRAMLIATDIDLSRLAAGEVVFDADGDWMMKGADGAMHQMMVQDEPSPCHLPANTVITGAPK